ncbi:30S ribosomal protein S4e [Candidatus Woesearchaeota archaeon]|nr:30S ribosomal protein S4e [Candidatus Woesearchaeota archaeon]
MAHLSRSRAPKNWPIKRKETKWTTRSKPGAHSLDRCITFSLVIKEMLNYASTTREVRYILNNKSVIVNKKPVVDSHLGVGFMDTIEIPDTKEAYRMILNQEGKFELIALKKELENLKPYKVIGKKILKGKRLQLNLIDGKNILADKDVYKTGDTVVIDLSNNSIQTHLKLEKGSEVFLLGGKHRGVSGKVTEIIKEKNLNEDRVLIKTKDSQFETLKKYVFVIEHKFLEK